MNDEPRRSTLGQGVVEARAQERDARLRAENLQQQAAQANQAWLRAYKLRERAELWLRADELRHELAEVENKAGQITLGND